MDRSSIIGALVALEIYLQTDHKKTVQEAHAKVNYLIDELSEIPNITFKILDEKNRIEDPLQVGLQITFDNKTPEETYEIVKKLLAGDPEILPGYEGNNIIINITSFRGINLLHDGDEEIIAKRLKRAARGQAEIRCKK